MDASAADCGAFDESFVFLGHFSLGVEAGENVAEMIMRGRTVREGPQTAQELQLLPAEKRDLDEAIGPGEDGQLLILLMRTPDSARVGPSV